ncbi:MAG: transporter substrate-binding domain-containing protein [Salinivirgaceae bacterium]|nr:transporter substrate-binding domain-containing protein [Salinivirgaceae bacterium]
MKFKLLLFCLLCLSFLCNAHNDNEIVVGCDYNYPPYSYVDNEGNPRGFDVDVINSICEITGIKVTYKFAQWDSVLSMLNTGKVDVVASIVYSEKREYLYDFSFPLHTEYYAIFSNNSVKIKDVYDLKEKKLAVLKGDISNEMFLKPTGLYENFVLSKSIPEALHFVNEGIVDYVIAPYPLGMEVMKKSKLMNVSISGVPIIPSVYCLGVKEGNSSLLAHLNAGIQEISRNGKLDAIYNKWVKYKREDEKYEKFYKISLIVIIVLLVFSAILTLFFYSIKKQVQKKSKIIKEAEVIYQRIYNSVDDPIFIMNEAGLLINVNEQALSFYNLKKENLSSVNAQNLIDKENVGVYDFFLAAIKKNGLCKIDAKKIKDGKEIFLHITGSEIELEGEFWFLIIYKDVTKEKKSLLKIEETRVAAESANNTKSRFLASISHEIRTPLNAVIGFADLLKKSGLRKKQLVQANKINLAANMLLNLVNNILDITKIEANKLELQEQAFLVKDVIRNIINVERVKSKNKSVSLNCFISDDVPEVVFGDELRLVQVLMNVINNAIKYTPQGEVKVVVYIEQKPISKESESMKLIFSIKDTGIGIPLNIQDQIFQPFAQAQNSIKRKYEGTGLGLAISKQLVDLMKGEIVFESEINEGSEFTISIPFKYSMHDRKSIKKNKLILVEEYPRTKLHILLVEDNELNAEIFIAQLEEYKFSVEHAESGFKALELLKNNNYDVILMDIEMPGMNGFETMGKIFEMGKQFIPVIALSAHALDSEKSKALELGMIEYLYKPIEPEVLVNNIYHLVHKFNEIRKNNKSAISYEKGIVFFGENQELYHRALTRFKETYSTTYLSAFDLLEKDKTALRDLTHNLKSGAEMIGAHKLHLLAKKYDYEFREQESYITKEKVNLLIDELAIVLDEI